MSAKTKLELTWIGKENRPKLEPRILVEDPDLSYHANVRHGSDIFDNKLIFGDNLLALKALEADYAGLVKCVFIDPPYNTGSAFEQYDDGIEHSLWLSLMRDRLQIIKRLLSKNGSLWITLDDNEAHYCKVLCDEVFGRNNFLADVIWEKADSPRMDARFFSSRHDHLLVYASEISSFELGRLKDPSGNLPAHYDKIDATGKRYYLKPLRAMGQADTREDRPTMYYALNAPDGSQIFPKKQDGSDGRWRWKQDKVEEESKRIEWVKGRNGWVPYFRIYGSEEDSIRPPETIWFGSDVGTNRTSKSEVKAIFTSESAFSTPKPEKLVTRVIELATSPGDIVLDSFLGSGTTAAVAHKMGRRWIGIELGEHCHTHCIPRLRKVIDGQDSGGITEAVGWQGGGGFRYYKLAPSLLEQDKWGRWVISKEYNPTMLAEALCKLEGFRYEPSDSIFWMHGRSSEQDFLYATTQTLSHEQLQALSAEVGPNRSLLILCAAFRGNANDFPNLTLKKIPKTVQSKCEWGHDDYSLKVENLPQAPERPANTATATRKGKAKASSEPDLFGEAGA